MARTASPKPKVEAKREVKDWRRRRGRGRAERVEKVEERAGVGRVDM